MTYEGSSYFQDANEVSEDAIPWDSTSTADCSERSFPWSPNFDTNFYNDSSPLIMDEHGDAVGYQLHQLEPIQPLDFGKETEVRADQPIPPAPGAPERASVESPDSQKKTFSCPVYEADIVLNRPHTCRGARAESMAHVRRHLKQGRNPHVTFLELCGTCSEHVLDKQEFDTRHGKGGEYCNNVKKQARGKFVEAQWIALYEILNPGAPVPSPYGKVPQPPSNPVAQTTPVSPNNSGWTSGTDNRNWHNPSGQNDFIAMSLPDLLPQAIPSLYQSAYAPSENSHLLTQERIPTPAMPTYFSGNNLRLQTLAPIPPTTFEHPSYSTNDFAATGSALTAADN